MKALKELLLCYGFTIEQTIGVGFYPFPLKLAKAISKIAKAHAVFLTVRAKKKVAHHN